MDADANGDADARVNSIALIFLERQAKNAASTVLTRLPFNLA